MYSRTETLATSLLETCDPAFNCQHV